MAESIRKQMEKERLDKTIPCIRITRGARRINHSKFSNVTILIGGDSTIISQRFKEILEKNHVGLRRTNK